MKSQLSQFLMGLDGLDTFITGIEKHNALISYIPSRRDRRTLWKRPNRGSSLGPLLSDYRRHYTSFMTKRTLDYNTVIISLYGYLESFIEGLIKNYLVSVCRLVPNYSDLPEKIRDTHFGLSADLIRNLVLPKYQNLTTREDIVKNLYSCIETPEAYRLNPDAYTHHTSNFRFETIEKCFGTVGVDSLTAKIKNHGVFQAYLRKAKPDILQIRPESAFGIINDLADRRNEVGHGAGSEILSHDILREYIAFLRLYGPILYDVLRNELVAYEMPKAIKLCDPIQIIANKIACIELSGTQISVGDTLITRVKGSPAHLYSGEIVELQVDGVSLDCVDPAPSVMVGIRVGFTVKPNYDLFLLKTRGLLQPSSPLLPDAVAL